MKLLTKAQRAELVAATAAETKPDTARVKLFDPSGRYTFYVFEAEEREDGELVLYGYCVSPLGPDCDEWGYAALSELQAVTGRFGLGLERDLWFDGITRAEIAAGVRK